MKRIIAWLRDLPPFAILAAGWLVFFMHAYPGRMTRDSFDQLRQARTGIYLDDHPPLMQAIVSITDRVLAGPIGPVVLQSLMLLAGAYLLLRRAMRPHIAAIVAVVFLLFPPSAAVMVVMWKDPLMAGALLLATALLLDPRRRVRLVALGLVFVATGVRFNALAATFAIVILLFEWRNFAGTKWRARAKRYGLALGVWSAVTAAAFGFNSLITDRETHFAETMLVDDIVGTLRFVKPDRSDAELRSVLAGTRMIPDQNIHKAIRKAYNSESVMPTLLGPDRVFDHPLADVAQLPAEVRAAVVRAWKAIVFGYPRAYLYYRVDRFRVLLGLAKRRETFWDRPIIVTHEYQDKQLLWQFGVSTTISPAQEWIDEQLTALSHTWLFRPYIYFFLSLALLVLARRNALVAALLLSGLGIELSMFFLAHSPDYRYSHWMICTSVLSAILLFAERYVTHSARENAAEKSAGPVPRSYV
jgi:hypothetical protein